MSAMEKVQMYSGLNHNYQVIVRHPIHIFQSENYIYGL